MTLTVVLVAAYLLGSIPTSYIVVYRYTGRDIRTLGSGNPGAMNVLDTLGFVPAAIVGSGDILKGMAAVGIAYLAGLGDTEAVLAAIVAVIGHDYTVFLRLHGGNGTAAVVGGFAALVPIATLVASSVAVALWLTLRSRRAAGMIALLTMPGLAYWFEAPDVKVAGVIVLLTITALKIIRFEGFSAARARHDR